jgi:uncharacterized phage-associated protein
MGKGKSSNYSAEKLQHVILYFLERINNIHLGKTKLMKLLYFVDFDHYETYGRSVTGAVYRKFPHGPYPKDADKLLERMSVCGQLKQVGGNRHGYTQQRLITLSAKFDPSKFSGEELQTLERVATRWADATAAQIEAATHDEAPWAATLDGSTIDYEMAEYRHPLGFEPLDKVLATSRKFANYVTKLA